MTFTTGGSPPSEPGAAAQPFPYVEQPQPRRRRRRTATPVQRLAVTVVAALSGLPVLFADAHPTGVGTVDAVQRVAVAVLLVLAGSRARRWALVWASGVAAAASLGWGLLLGLTALALSVFLIGNNRRDRVYGGVIGGLVAIVLFHLQLDWFLGERTLVALVAAVPLLASGFRNSSRKYRRGWLIAGGVVAVVVVASAFAVAVVGWQARTDLLSAVNHTTAAVSATQSGDTAQATHDFDEAAARFNTVASDTDVWWLAPARAVPVVGQNLAAVRDAATAGGKLTRTAANTTEGVDYDRIRRPEGGIDLAVLESFGGAVDEAAGTLKEADTKVANLRSPWLVGILSHRLDQFGTRVQELRSETEMAQLAIAKAPAILGAGGTRRYLLLLGNPAEARDLGGHLGNWAELTATDGKIDLVEVGQPMELEQPISAGIPDEESFPASLLAMRPLLFPQNWGSSPDLPTVTRLAASLYQQRTGRAVDGVFYADPYAFAAFVSLTGPVPVPGLPFMLGADGAAEFLTKTQFQAFAQESQADRALNELVSTVFDKVTNTKLPGPRQLGDLFGPLVRQGRFRFDTLHADDAPLLARAGLQGAIPDAGDDGDLVGVIQRNANPNKIDAYLRRTNKVTVDWDPTTGEVTERVEVTLSNDAPLNLPKVVIGNDAGQPAGTNLTDVAVISTLDLDDVTLDGRTTDSRPVWDGKWWRYTTRVAVPPGATVVVGCTLSGLIDRGDVYRLFVKGQPLVNRGSTTLTVRATSGTIRPGPGMTVTETARGSTVTVRLRDDTDTLAAFAVER